MFGRNKEKQVKEVRETEIAEFKEVQEQPLSLGQKIKRYGKIALCCLVILAAAVITLMIVFREKKAPQIYFYVDENNCLYTGELDKPQKTKLWTENYQADGTEFLDAGPFMVQLSADGKKLYYPAQMKEDGSFSLYVSDYKAKEGDGELLVPDVLYYEVAKNGKVVYLKKDGSLNVMSGIEINCLSFHAEAFWISENGKNIIWQEPEENGNGQSQFFFQDLNLKKDKKKLQGGVEEILFVSADLKTVYFEKDDNLYRIKNQGEKEKIVEDFAVWYGYDETDDSFYYMAGKQSDLYYFDGKESTLIQEDTYQVLACGKDFVMYAVKDKEVKWYIVKETAVSRADLDDMGAMGEASYHTLNEEGIERTMYFSVGEDTTGEKIYLLTYGEEGTLYAISYADGTVGLTEAVDSKVERLDMISGGKAYYIKDSYYAGSSYLGDVYCEGELLAEDVAIGLSTVKGESLFFYQEWDAGEMSGTLLRCKDGKTKKVADNVFYYTVQSEKLVFLQAPLEGESFELSYYNGKKVKKIAEDVVFFEVK